MSEGHAAAEMPRYRCHKEVWALKIKAVTRTPFGSAGVRWTIIPEDEGYAPFDVDFEYMEKHTPRAGGYYVVYQDGYKSFSPADAFESGYTRI